MAIPSSGAISLSTIQTEFGGSNPISLNEYYAGGSLVPAGTSGTYGAVPSSGAISLQNFYGTTAFTAVFNNSENINVVSTASSGQLQSVGSAYVINSNATCTKTGAPAPSPANGPTAWGTPTGGTPGNNFEARLNVTGTNTQGLSYVRFAGVDVTATGFTSWYALSSNRAIELNTEGNAYIEGTLYIRNTTSLVEISRAFYVSGDNGA